MGYDLSESIDSLRTWYALDYDPLYTFLIAFLLGAGIGFIEDDYIICPHCGCEFPEEDMRLVEDQYACPACLEPLQED